MKQLKSDFLQDYVNSTKDLHLEQNLANIQNKQNDISFDFAVSSVYSSNIEGNSIDLNSFFNYDSKVKITREKEEIDNLIKVYNFARTNNLSYENLLASHKILSKTFLEEFQQGKIRSNPVGVFGSSGLIYMAVEADKVEREVVDLLKEVEALLKAKLTTQEIFYYASFLHLRIAHIHPFADGNGRIARLIEKWFLAQKLGEIGWKIKSEQFYKENQKQYYTRL
jgi:Fic family protein